MNFCIAVLLTILAVPVLRAQAGETAETCPVSKAPDPPFVPPAPYRAVPNWGFWYGSPQLWVQLSNDGIMGRINKLFLWREGYHYRDDPEFRPKISLVLRRLDAEAPVVTQTSGTSAHFDSTWTLLTGFTFPTPGCWEVTSSYRDGKVTFVVLVRQ